MEIIKNTRRLSESEISQYKNEGYIKNLPVFSEKGIKELQQLRSRASNLFATGSQSYNAGWQTCFDLINLIDVSLAIAYSALERKESRGAHTRIDFPTPSDPLGKVKFIISLSSGKFNISSVSIPTPRKELLAMIKKDQTKQKSSGKK